MRKVTEQETASLLVAQVEQTRRLLQQEDAIYGDFDLLAARCQIVSQSQSGKVMQRRVLYALGLRKSPTKEVDAVDDFTDFTYEVKTTRMDSGVMHFHEIRLAAGADRYLLVAYHFCAGTKPFCQVFDVPAAEMTRLLLKCGRLSHGDGGGRMVTDKSNKNHNLACRVGSDLYNDLCRFQNQQYQYKIMHCASPTDLFLSALRELTPTGQDLTIGDCFRAIDLAAQNNPAVSSWFNDRKAGDILRLLVDLTPEWRAKKVQRGRGTGVVVP
jgi:hypothetical protein